MIELLVADFPYVPELDIRHCVQQIRAEFAHATVRTYIPILVARRARLAFASLPVTARHDDGAPSGQPR